jgi:hypothetical protein
MLLYWIVQEFGNERRFSRIKLDDEDVARPAAPARRRFTLTTPPWPM